jgi:hypothetical protein
MTMAYSPYADWAREDREVAAGTSVEHAINEALLDAVEAVEAIRPLLDKIEASAMWDDLRSAVRTLEEMHAWSEANRGWTTAEVI